MKTFQIKALHLSFAACITFSSVGAWAINGKPAIDKNTVVFAIERDIAMLDAQIDNTGNSDRYHWQMYDGLYTFDKKGVPIPQIATDMSVSSDGLEYKFTMRRDVKCHNGMILTSKDAKFAFDRILDPAAKSTRRPYFANFIDNVSTPDDATVVVRLKQQDAVFINKVAAFVPLIPKDYIESLSSQAAFSRAPVGCGPYKFVEHKIGQSVELARFDDYYGDKPGITRLIFKFIPDAGNRVNAVLNGEVDMADGIAPSDVARIKRGGGIDLLPVPLGSPLHIRLYSNVPGTPLSDRRVRLALNHAIDVQAIVKSVMHGIGQPLTTFISSYYPIGVDPALKPYEFNPALAKKLLAEAGYGNGFEIELLSPTTYSKDVTEAVVAYWSAVGVRARIRMLDYPAWNRMNNTHQSGPMTVMQFSNALYAPASPIIGTASKSGTWSDYFNPDVEALIAKSASISDRNKRDEIFRAIAKLMRDDGHAVLISERFSVFAKDPSISWEPQHGFSFYNLRNLSRN